MMQQFLVKQTALTPEIHFSPDNNFFLIKGTSAPEDVRALYYPVIDWIKMFVDEVIKGNYKSFNRENPLKFQIDLFYFNSSSAKFFYDIFLDLKRLPAEGCPVSVEWYYDEEDVDMKEAGGDIALLAEMEFTFIPKKIRS